MDYYVERLLEILRNAQLSDYAQLVLGIVLTAWAVIRVRDWS